MNKLFIKLINALKKFFARNWKRWTIVAILAILFYIGFVFYKYVYIPLFAEKEITPFKLEIKDSLFKSIILNETEKQERVNQILNKEYLDPFK